MVLYFVFKLKLVSNKPARKNIQKNKVTLLCYSANDEEAWNLVKREAKNYMTKKNEKLCDQTDGDNESVREMYVIRESKQNEDKVNTIEVYKQWRECGAVWGSTKKEMKVAEFSMSKFEDEVECSFCAINVSVKRQPDIKAIATVIGTMTPKLLSELKNSEMFRERIRQINKYSRPLNNVSEN